MTAWIVLLALVALFALAARHGRSADPPAGLCGYERDRQLAELRALTTTDTHALLP